MPAGNFFTGSPATSQQFPTITPQQSGIKGAVNTQAMKLLQGLGGGQFNFEPIANLARSQFQSQTLPSIAERFTAMGPGAQRGSAFQSQLGQAGSDLEQGLAALQSQYGLQQQGLQQQLLQSLLGFSLSPEVETGISEEEPGFFQKILPVLLQVAPSLVEAYFGNPTGGTAGAAAGSGIKELFNKYFGSNQAPGVNLPNYSNRIQNVTGKQPAGVNLPNYNALINSVIGVK